MRNTVEPARWTSDGRRKSRQQMNAEFNAAFEASQNGRSYAHPDAAKTERNRADWRTSLG